MKKLFYAMLVAVVATVGFASCGSEMDDAALKEAITGQSYEGTFNDATMRIVTTAGYNYVITVAALPISMGTYTVTNKQMIMTDTIDEDIYTADIEDKGKTLILLGDGVTVTLKQTK